MSFPPSNPPLPRRSGRIWTYCAVGIGGAFLLMLLPFLLGSPDDLSPAVRIVSYTLASALTAGWGFVFGTLLFRRYDEFRREGSKYAWYWGATGGLCLSLPIYVFIALGGLHWLDPGVPAGKAISRAFILGYSLPLACQMAGFGLVALWWRASKR